MSKITNCPNCSGTDFTLSESTGWKASFDEEGVLECFQKTNGIDAIVCDNRECLYELSITEIDATECNFN